ncbi:MAG TPA: glycosyltransferase family 4 protein [Solirubrobacteraceae bacterium]|nr:glycosyltransferase family 4 protein [Solirubrobacteraceae bacterium]
MLADDTQALSDGSPELDETVGSVLFVTPRWARDGGVGAHVVASANALAARGVHVQVLTQRVEAEADGDGVTLCESEELFNSRASMQRRLGQALSCDPDVIHLHQVDDPEIARELRTSAPVVISAHGYTACTSGVYYFAPGEECVRGHGPGCIPNLALRGCAHTNYPKTLPMKYRSATRGLAALRGAELAVSYSSSVDRHLAANGITRRMVVPYFPTMAPKPASDTGSGRRVVFAGRIVRPKGVDVLIRAARDVDAEFVICGDGRQLEEMRSLAAELGVQERVCFRGWLDADQLAEELANASIVVVPSLWPEPFGLVGIEGQAAGRPAVASATGGIVDWLDDGVSGLSVPPGDAGRLAQALNELLADPERRRAMGIAGRRAVAERFSADTHLRALLEGYRNARSTWDSLNAVRS